MSKGASVSGEKRIVEMHEMYPFGELKEASHGEGVLVRKKLVYHNASQLEIIKKMVQFLSTLDSEFLIQLRHSESSG
jgi:hypothetical protein